MISGPSQAQPDSAAASTAAADRMIRLTPQTPFSPPYRRKRNSKHDALISKTSHVIAPRRHSSLSTRHFFTGGNRGNRAFKKTLCSLRLLLFKPPPSLFSKETSFQGVGTTR